MERNKSIIFKSIMLVSLLLITILIVGCGNNNDGVDTNNVINTPPINTLDDIKGNVDIYENKVTGTMEEGDVRIDLTPKGIVEGKFVIEFGVNTHYVAMDSFDFTKITSLEYYDSDNMKQSIKPTSASKLGGHHSYGEIAFDLGREPKDFNIRINGIPKVEERLYSWSEK